MFWTMVAQNGKAGSRTN